MAKTEKTGAPAKAERKPRTILTPAERIAKMQADVEALKLREAEKARKAMVSLEEKSAKLKAKRDEIDAELVKLGEQHVALSVTAAPVTEPAAAAAAPNES